MEYGDFTMNKKNLDMIKAYAEFFRDKPANSNKLEDFVKEHRQSEGGYIDLAEAFEFYNYLNENMCDIEKATGLKKEEILEPGKNPNQKWHFMISYLCFRQFEKKQPNLEELKCPELCLWILEVLGAHETVLSDVYNNAVALKNKQISENGNDYTISRAFNKVWVPYIKQHLREAEKKLLEQLQKADG